jgi:hypothetical protein
LEVINSGGQLLFSRTRVHTRSNYSI